MKFAKQAVKYYTLVTGNVWSKFYDDMDEALSGDLNDQTGDLWLIHSLLNLWVKQGKTINDFKMGKDVVKAEFDEDGRKQNGEFFTPVIWAEEAHRYLDKYIPDWRTKYNVWENSCYSMKAQVYIKRQFDTTEHLYAFLDSMKASTSFMKWGTNDTVFEGYIPASMLTPDDLVLSYGDKNLEYSRYFNFFTKMYTGKMYCFLGEDSFAKVEVTADHTMLVSLNGELERVSAEELYNTIQTTDRTYFVSYRSDGMIKYEYITACISRDAVEEPVWCLTTECEAHNFLVSLSGNNGVFCGNCGSGNLIRTANITPEHLFASTLQEDDVRMIANTPELKGCHAFQLDFLSAIDDGFNNSFLETLPEELQQVILNDEPLIMLCNPPYKSGMAKATIVGQYMMDSRAIPDYDFTDFSKPAYDMFYQFCFQTMNLVTRFNLSNLYYCFFGPLTFFTGAGANILLQKFEHCFEFVDGMCISAQEFSDTSDSILWGVGYSIWKARGGYQDGDNFHKDILLDKKFIKPEGDIGCEGKVLYEPPRQKLSDWVAPASDGISTRVEAPLMTSHLTFKGSEVFQKVAPKSGLILPNALGTLMVGNTLTRSADQSAVLSMPTTIQYVDITEENFWRCVSSYAFRRTIDAGWAIAKKEISAPNPNIEGYDLWLRNALVAFLFEYKSMMSSLRNVEWGGYTDYAIQNRLFYLSEDQVREHCHDPIILEDMEKYPFQNQFMLQMIEESKPYWVPEIKELFDWCVTYTTATYDCRKTVNYKGSIECADAGFQQLRAGLWDSEKLDEPLTKLLTKARSWLRKDLSRFGFVSEVENEVDL